MEQRKKNIYLLLSLVVLMAVSILLFLFGNVEDDPVDPALFKIPGSATVDRVLLERPNEKVDLLFKSGEWRVNNVYDADRNMIDVLFATMNQAIPKRAAASRVRDSVIQQISKSGIKATFFSGPTIQREFLVWGDGNSGITYFSDPVQKNPYVMVIPGYRVQVSGIFEQNANAWRDKRIFNFNWRNFKELHAQFPRDPKQNFTVAMSGRYFSIVNELRVDTAALNNYLDAISLIRADQFYIPGTLATTDSLLNSSPVMSIEVKDVANNSNSFKLFEVAKSQSKAIGQWENDYVWLDRRDILPIYKKKKDFVR
jgi:hypothetical protein